MDDSQVVEATAVRADLVARPGVLDEEAAALARVARVLALELGVGEAGLNGHRHTEGLCFWGGRSVSAIRSFIHSTHSNLERERDREKAKPLRG